MSQQQYIGYRAAAPSGASQNAPSNTPTRSMRSNLNMTRSGSARNVLNRGASVANRPLPILERGSSMRNMRSLPDRRHTGGSSRRFLYPEQTRNNSSTSTATNSNSSSTNTTNSNSNNNHQHSPHTNRSNQSNRSENVSLSAHIGRVSLRSHLERSNSVNSIDGSLQTMYTSRSAGGESDADLSSILSMSSVSMASRTLGNHDSVTSTSGMDSLFSRDSVTVRQRQMEAAAMERHNGQDYDMMSTSSSSECTIYSFDVRPPPVSLLNNL